MKCDIKTLPLPDAHADRIAAIHVVEHFYKWELDAVLKEWLRVLKPGGQLILELPCMEKVFGYIVRMVQQGLPMSPTFSWFAFYGDPKYESVAMTHKWGYTFKMLREVLVMAGYERVSYQKARYHFPERDMRLEAYKPS